MTPRLHYSPLSLLVRSWNVYHGRTHPPGRRTHLRRMVELVTEDAPDVVALQEVPLWALGRLERWTGMAVRWSVTVPSLLVAPLARLVTEVDAARLRSLFTGQANVLLVGRRLAVGEQRLLVLNPDVTRWEWLLRRGRQRRVCQVVELEVGGRTLAVANLHTTNDARLAVAEAERAAVFVGDAAACVLCGDFNVPRLALPGFSPPIDGIDQILVRGLELERGPAAWAPERRTVEGRVLSDHSAIEAVVASRP